MNKYHAAEIYETDINGTIFCFRYSDPETWNEGKSYHGVATVWEKGTEEHFTVPFYVKADDIDQVYFKIIEGIEKHLRN